MGWLKKILSGGSARDQTRASWPSDEHAEPAQAILALANRLTGSDGWVSIWVDDQPEPCIQVTQNQINLLLCESDLPRFVSELGSPEASGRLRTIGTGLYQLIDPAPEEIAHMAMLGIRLKLGRDPVQLRCRLEQ